MATIKACDGTKHLPSIVVATYHIETHVNPDGNYTTAYNTSYDYCFDCFTNWLTPMTTGTAKEHNFYAFRRL
jgi:hypothetical protein